MGASGGGGGKVGGDGSGGGGAGAGIGSIFDPTYGGSGIFDSSLNNMGDGGGYGGLFDYSPMSPTTAQFTPPSQATNIGGQTQDGNTPSNQGGQQQGAQGGYDTAAPPQISLSDIAALGGGGAGTSPNQPPAGPTGFTGPSVMPTGDPGTQGQQGAAGGPSGPAVTPGGGGGDPGTQGVQGKAGGPSGAPVTGMPGTSSGDPTAQGAGLMGGPSGGPVPADQGLPGASTGVPPGSQAGQPVQGAEGTQAGAPPSGGADTFPSGGAQNYNLGDIQQAVTGQPVTYGTDATGTTTGRSTGTAVPGAAPGGGGAPGGGAAGLGALAPILNMVGGLLGIPGLGNIANQWAKMMQGGGMFPGAGGGAQGPRVPTPQEYQQIYQQYVQANGHAPPGAMTPAAYAQQHASQGQGVTGGQFAAATGAPAPPPTSPGEAPETLKAGTKPDEYTATGGIPSAQAQSSGGGPDESITGTPTRQDPRGLIPYIQSEARRIGIDPATAVRVAESEGLANPVGDGGMSHGAFQLYNGGGEGNRFQQQTGLNPADPKNEKKTITYALQRAKQVGWGPWHGAARVGIGQWQGIAGVQPQQTEARASGQLISNREADAMPGNSMGPPGSGQPPAMGWGAVRGSQQQSRPAHYTGTVSVGGRTFRFGSGGGRTPSLPYGKYYLTNGVGRVGSSLRSRGFVDNAIAGISDTPSGNTVNDPQQGRQRLGTELHPASNSRSMATNGCIGVDPQQWGQFKQAYNSMRGGGGQMVLEVAPNGRAYIYNESHQAATQVAQNPAWGY